MTYVLLPPLYRWEHWALRVVEQAVQDRTASERQSWHTNLGSLAPEYVLLNSLLYGVSRQNPERGFKGKI